MLPAILNAPKTPEDWARWSFNHRSSHDLIRQAIRTQFNVDLPDYQLDPIELHQTKLFLEANQQAHTDFNGVLKLPGSDLEDINVEADRELQSWVYLHWQEHNIAERALGISS